MPKTAINTENAPKAIGPYSQAIRSDNLLFCSGQLPVDPKTGKLVEGGVEQQTDQVMKNLSAILKESGCDLNSVLKTTIYIKNMDDFSIINGVYAKYFQEPFPARATVQVAKLPLDVDVEIDAVAKIIS